MSAVSLSSPRHALPPEKSFVPVLLAAMPAVAQSPPARVGRISIVEGTLAFYQEGDPD